MRLSTRRADDADVIRARLRALLQEGARPRGWLPADDPVDLEPDPADPGTEEGGNHRAEAAGDPDDHEGRLPHGIGRHRAPGTAVRLDPGRRAAWSLWVAGFLGALLLAGLTWVDRPQVEPAPAAPTSAPDAGPPAPATPEVGAAADTAVTVVVSVVGLVARPGLVVLPEGSRVADAVAAAGGMLPEADPASVNLAAVVTDGQQVAVGVPGAAAVGSGPPGSVPESGGPVNLNTATAADLDALPGIGPVLAQRIVDHRDRHGRFTSVEQLDDVPGIGPTTYAELADLVTV